MRTRKVNGLKKSNIRPGPKTKDKTGPTIRLPKQEVDTRPVDVPPSSTDGHHWEQPGELVPLHEDFIRSYLGSYSREPFLRQLAKFLGCAPTRQAIQTFANRNPDRWANSIKVLGNMAGYRELISSEVNVNFNVHNMSDSQVEARLAELEELLKGADTIDAVPIDPAKLPDS